MPRASRFPRLRTLDTFRLVTIPSRRSALPALPRVVRPTVRLAALLLALSMAGAPTRAAAQDTGAFLATRIDESALPLADRVTDDEGTTYLVEFERLVLSLRGGNRFRASVRFRRTLISSDPRAQGRTAPIQSLTVSGTYAVTEGEIAFTPDSTGDGKGLRMLAGRVTGRDRITVPFTYRNGTVQRRRVLELVRRDDIL